MTREELKAHCIKQIQHCEQWAEWHREDPHGKVYEEHKLILELIDQTEECEDAISRAEALKVIDSMLMGERDHKQKAYEEMKNLPSVQPKQKTGHCRDCKHWKDSDGVYRRGIGAKSQCPINRKEVYDGNGYCFLFEKKESEGENGI